MSKSDELEAVSDELGCFQYRWQNEFERIINRYFPDDDIQYLNNKMTKIQDELFELLDGKVKEVKEQEALKNG